MGLAESTGAEAKPRLLALDLLRLVAVLLVIGRHTAPAPEGWSSTLRTISLVWRRGGWVGVDLFFVLSGFLVSGLLFAEFKRYGRISPLRFFARRAWKIYPAYFAMLGTTIAVIPLLHGRYEPIQLAAEAFFFQNYVKGLWNHTWSLAVEEHFYVLLPLVCVALLHVGGRRPAPLRPILLVGAVVAVYALFARIGTVVENMEYSPYTHVYPTHLRLDSLFFGVMLSYAHQFHGERFTRALRPWRIPLIIFGCILLAPAFLLRLDMSALMNTVGYTVMYLGAGMILVGALLLDVKRGRITEALGGLGSYSYSIYLWHMPVMVLALPQLERLGGGPIPPALRLALYVGGSFAVGVVMAKLIEVPALRLRDRHFPSRSAPTPARMPGRSIETPVGSIAIV